MRRHLILAAAGGAFALATAPMVRAAGPEVPFPLGYRTWVHVKSGWIGEGGQGFPRFGGMHHIYGNPAAMRGYKTGAFPVGSMVVFDLLETKQGSGSLTTGERKFRDVMQKTAEGWHFSEFAANSHTERNITTEAGAKECAACHEQAKTDHVFSSFADTAEN